jgi:uncharacterized membrane protein
MSRANPPARVALSRVLAFGVLGGLVALVLGLAALALAPDNGFADLAVSAVTRVFLVPLGILAGAVAGWFTGRR